MIEILSHWLEIRSKYSFPLEFAMQDLDEDYAGGSTLDRSRSSH